MTQPAMDRVLGHDANPLAQAEDPSPTPAPSGRVDNLTTSTDASGFSANVQAAMRNATAVLRGERVTVASSQDSFGKLRGVDNPYGTGIYAYEPNTTILEDYSKSYNAVENSKAEDAAKQGSTITVPDLKAAPQSKYASGGFVKADSKVATFVQAALTAASNGVPYVWGGTNIATGVDCSGLVYAAAKAAGIPGVQRWRASDYGKLGAQVDMNDARPGDLVYYDEPGATDHVGIYLGGGKMVAAPQTGENVKVQNVYGSPQFRRVFNDASFGTVGLPDGSATYNYNQTYYNPAQQVNRTTNQIIRTSAGRNKAI